MPAEKYDLACVLTEQALDIILEAEFADKNAEAINALLDQACSNNFDAQGQYTGPLPKPVPTLWQEVKGLFRADVT